MALYIPHSIFHLARFLYVRPETFGPYYEYESNKPQIKLKIKSFLIMGLLNIVQYGIFYTSVTYLNNWRQENIEYNITYVLSVLDT